MLPIFAIQGFGLDTKRMACGIFLKGNVESVPAMARAWPRDGMRGAKRSHRGDSGGHLERSRPYAAVMRDARGTCSALPKER